MKHANIAVTQSQIIFPHAFYWANGYDMRIRAYLTIDRSHFGNAFSNLLGKVNEKR